MKPFCLTPWSRASLAAAAALLLNACAPGQDTPTPTSGVNLSHYLAVGDSYTAGVSSGGLTRNSQNYSFPNLLAQQFRGATPGATFTQPLLEEGTGSGFLDFADYTPAGPPRISRVAGTAVRGTVINPNACGGADTLRLLSRSASSDVLPQNLGVPGLLLGQVEATNLGNEASATPGGTFNPYFSRLLPAADSRTYVSAVTTAAAPATFFTFFQGLDDMMVYVRSGGACGLQLPTVNTLATQNNRTQAIAALRLNAQKVLDRPTAGGRPGIIARLPALATLPFLRQGRGLTLQTRLQATFRDTARLYIQDPFGGTTPQPITDNDYVLATALLRVGQMTPVRVGATTVMLPYGRDIRNPLRDADVLDNALEVPRINTVVNGYNSALEDLATTVYKLPIITAAGTQRTLDLDVTLFNQVANVISVAGVTYSSEPVRGNVFSLDYYTLTPRGNGLLANAFILAINKTYQANIPFVDVNTLPTVAR